MSSVEDRLAALERAVIELRQQQTDTHMLAAHADADVAEFRREIRDQTGLINATRLDMGELRGAVGRQGERMDAGFARMAAGFAAIGAQLDRLVGQPQEEEEG